LRGAGGGRARVARAEAGGAGAACAALFSRRFFLLLLHRPTLFLTPPPSFISHPPPSHPHPPPHIPQNDTKKLAEAKALVYLKGFTDGVLRVGPHAGKKVSDVKGVIRAEMLEAGEAISYSEPERAVTSRSGDDCVVALTDQWCVCCVCVCVVILGGGGIFGGGWGWREMGGAAFRWTVRRAAACAVFEVGIGCFTPHALFPRLLPR
jgi:hypothetical protein